MQNWEQFSSYAADLCCLPYNYYFPFKTNFNTAAVPFNLTPVNVIQEKMGWNGMLAFLAREKKLHLMVQPQMPELSTYSWLSPDSLLGYMSVQAENIFPLTFSRKWLPYLTLAIIQQTVLLQENVSQGVIWETPLLDSFENLI